MDFILWPTLASGARAFKTRRCCACRLNAGGLQTRPFFLLNRSFRDQAVVEGTVVQWLPFVDIDQVLASAAGQSK
jgi:hypothetical protein